ncbi:hypothetical protein ABR737_09160 [Streptomyces sp. Edi2]|uniref:aggregation-promoting factor C-terminal-like domain-containing protein n=1 Tax=Streptomyces sp. Edi2 TaxID=3162528 RepID=UPI0033067D97
MTVLSSALGLAAQWTAHQVLGEFGWGEKEWVPLRHLWGGESSWKRNADNSSSGAYGIPQALPGSKMASAGSDWRTNATTQIKWGMGYIKNRCGSPASQWDTLRANVSGGNASANNFDVTVRIGDRDITEIVDVQVSKREAATASAIDNGRWD